MNGDQAQIAAGMARIEAKLDEVVGDIGEIKQHLADINGHTRDTLVWQAKEEETVLAMKGWQQMFRDRFEKIDTCLAQMAAQKPQNDGKPWNAVEIIKAVGKWLVILIVTVAAVAWGVERIIEVVALP